MKRKVHSILVKPLLTIVFVANTACHVFSQNVGIGTISPTEKLQVAGNLKVDTIKPSAMKLTANAGDGKILTSDAAGNASWQSKALAPGNIGYGVWGDCSTNGNISEYQPVADATNAASIYFGISVSVGDNYAVVGAFYDEVGANAEQGSASIYRYNGNSWVFMQKITDATGAAGDHFGVSVSISGSYAIVGAYKDDVGAKIDQGSASIYQFNGSSWVLMQKIMDNGGAANDHFGVSAAISGNHVIIGADLDDIGAVTDQGSASFYQYNGASWVLTQKSAVPTGASGDSFGARVSMSGTNAIIGAMDDDIGGNADQGSASIYHYNGTTGWDLVQTLTDATGASGDNFGSSVSIAGNYLSVGAFSDDVGSNLDQGSAFIYQFDGSSWVLMQKITEAGGAAYDFFGSGVSISDNYAMIGIPYHNTGTITEAGATTIYQRIGTGWQKMQYITDPGGNDNDRFGSATGINGITKQFIIGALGFNDGTGKAVFGRIN